MDYESGRLFFQLIIGGIIVGSIYGLVALGFVLIYKATDIINFAQGELMMFGAYICYGLITDFKIPFLAAFLLTLVFSACLGILIEVLILRPMVGEPIFSVIMITIALATLLRSIVGLIWGHDVYPFPTPFSDKPLDLFGLSLLPIEITTCVAVLGLVILFFLFFRYSRVGIAMRATAFNQKYALLMGISVRKIFSLAWLFASWWLRSGDFFSPACSTFIRI
jgi:branched-chain amino acid transport system permease protein